MHRTTPAQSSRSASSSTEHRARHGAASGSRVQMRHALRGLGFAAQEARLAPRPVQAYGGGLVVQRSEDADADFGSFGQGFGGDDESVSGAVGAGGASGYYPEEGGRSGEESEYGPYAPTMDNLMSDSDKKDDDKKDDDASSGTEIDVVPIQIAGTAIHFKAGTEGASVELTREFGLPGATYPLYPGVFVAWENKIGLGGVLTLKRQGDQLVPEGEVYVKLETGLYLKGGVPWANVFGGTKLELKMGSKYANGAFGTVSGGLDGALVVGAELKLPYDREPNMADPDGWSRQGGLKFEHALLKGRLMEVTIDSAGVHCKWVAGGAPMDSLRWWKEEYQRNIRGGGARGGPHWFPDGAGDTGGDDGAGGYHG